MYQEVKLLALLFPYLVFVAAGAFLGAAFVFPPLVFGTVGEGGVVITVAVTVASLAIIFTTEDGLVTIGTQLIGER
ncbi:hypothetical protein BRD04_08990 [Halobacteriales archaeon QS_9_67_17]|nr:MAG: hypothetical protein BRD04_08990 [Halobacteriales archaeon QS_9_67_17]